MEQNDIENTGTVAAAVNGVDVVGEGVPRATAMAPELAAPYGDTPLTFNNPELDALAAPVLENMTAAPDNVVDINSAKPETDDGARFDEEYEKLRGAVEAIAGSIDGLMQASAAMINAKVKMAQDDYASGIPARVEHAEKVFADLQKAMPQAWCDLATTQFKTGFMYLRRALEQPTTF